MNGQTDRHGFASSLTLHNKTVTTHQCFTVKMALTGASAPIPTEHQGARPLTLNAIAIPSSTPDAAALVVGLHGWGANAKDLATLAEFMDLSDYELLFPDGPFPHPQSFGGRMWYGFPGGYTFDANLDDQDDLAHSRQLLKDWLLSLEGTTGIPLSRTLLAGFSQGGAMTLDIGTQLPLAGLMILSGYLHAPLSAVHQPLPPILVVHGRQDPIVPLAAAQRSRDALEAVGATVTYHEFNMGHEIQPVVMEQIQSFVASTSTV